MQGVSRHQRVMDLPTDTGHKQEQIAPASNLLVPNQRLLGDKKTGSYTERSLQLILRGAHSLPFWCPGTDLTLTEN